EFQDGRIGRAASDAGGVTGRHRVEAAMKDPDVAVAMDVDADDLSPTASVHALGNCRPLLDEAIGIGQFGWFGIPGWLGRRDWYKQGDGSDAGGKDKS